MALNGFGRLRKAPIEPFRTVTVCLPIVLTTGDLIHTVCHSLTILSRQGRGLRFGKPRYDRLRRDEPVCDRGFSQLDRDHVVGICYNPDGQRAFVRQLENVFLSASCRYRDLFVASRVEWVVYRDGIY